LLWMHVCFCSVSFNFSVLSQPIGWEEHLRNDIFCVGWVLKPYLIRVEDKGRACGY